MDLMILQEKGAAAGFSLRPCLHTERREELAAEASPSGRVIVPEQIHGNKVVAVTEQILEGSGTMVDIPGCDGTVTDLPGVILTAKYADCIPLYFFDPAKGVIGLSHAGWRGTAGNIASVTVDMMTGLYGSDPSDIIACIGPGIGRCHFEVSQDVADVFMADHPWCGAFIDAGKAPGKYMMDLKGINSELLRKMGLRDIRVSPYCTFCDPERFYSYRRDAALERHLAWIRTYI